MANSITGSIQQPIPTRREYVWTDKRCHEKDTGRIVGWIKETPEGWFADVFDYSRGKMANDFGYIDEASIKRAVEGYLRYPNG